jgi:hypothetical protein
MESTLQQESASSEPKQKGKRASSNPKVQGLIEAEHLECTLQVFETQACSGMHSAV